ncbi:MAG: tetratricopeptide repeat protein [Sulfurihydrogenibium sp.]|nr:tetratricopeptide repeat protein [Sulfurihydrogenibium sp.]
MEAGITNTIDKILKKSSKKITISNSNIKTHLPRPTLHVPSLTPHIQHLKSLKSQIITLLPHRLLTYSYSISKCITFYNIQDYQKTIEFAKSAIQNNAKSVKAYIYLAKAYHRTGELKLAYENLKKAEKLTSNKHNLLDIYKETGEILQKMKQLNNAYTHLLKALNLAKELHDTEAQGAILNTIGTIYYNKKELDKAFDCYLDSLHLTLDKKTKANIYNNIALIYQEKNKHKKAIKYLQKAIEIAEKEGDIHNLSIYKLNLGYIHTKQKNYKSAIKYLSEGLDGIEKLQDKYHLSIAYKYIAKFHENRKEEDLAKEYYIKSKELIENKT